MFTRLAPWGAVLVVGLALAGTPAVAGAEPGRALARPAASADVFIVQALPDSVVSVSIDGKAAQSGVAPGDILGPLALPAGEHTVVVAGRNPAWKMEASVRTSAGGSTDVVLHRPASVDGQPTVTVYRNPVGPVAGDKGRVMVAHTATVPPADITVDGQVVFANIANGEFATAEVPVGNHKVSIVPTGRTSPVLLGPIDLSAQPRTLTQVFAVGQPAGGSMDVVVQTLPLEIRGSAEPDKVETGSAGLASELTPPRGPAGSLLSR
ncbi:MAG: DUF4397 domain-containing protein [Nocardioidaceae bacterium]|nr:DUF4397 domain-containing protein [Nocardioidaceae bacterium]